MASAAFSDSHSFDFSGAACAAEVLTSSVVRPSPCPSSVILRELLDKKKRCVCVYHPRASKAMYSPRWVPHFCFFHFLDSKSRLIVDSFSTH
jgi:hypothetical protein